MADDLQEQVPRHAQFLGLGTIVMILLSHHFRVSGDPKTMAQNWLNLVEALAEKMTFENVTPEVSDVAAQELRDSMVRMVLRAQALAAGEEFDPDAYQLNWRD